MCVQLFVVVVDVVPMLLLGHDAIAVALALLIMIFFIYFFWLPMQMWRRLSLTVPTAM